MLVTTALITLVVCAAVVGWRVTRSGANDDDRATEPWDELALVDRTTGDVTFVDPSGEVVRTSVGSGRSGSVLVAGGRVALANSTRLTVLPATDDGAPTVIDLPRGAEVDTIATDDRDLLVVGEPTGGTVTIVDPATDVVIDLGDRAAQELPSAPLLFPETLRWNHDGTRFAIADATNFQTVVVLTGEDGAVFLPDQPIAVGDELFAIGQTVGMQADIALVRLDRSTEAAVPTEIPAGGLIDGDTFTMVSIDGTIVRISAGADEAETIGSVAIPAGGTIRWARPTLDGRRLVVAGDTFQAVVDLDGASLFATTFSTATTVAEPSPRWQCLPVGGEGAWHSIIDLDTGEQLVALTGTEVVGVSADGCAVLTTTSGGAPSILSPEHTLSLGAVESAELGPDGRSAVRRHADGTIDLVTVESVDDEDVLGEPIDLTTLTGRDPLIAFVTDR